MVKYNSLHYGPVLARYNVPCTTTCNNVSRFAQAAIPYFAYEVYKVQRFAVFWLETSGKRLFMSWKLPEDDHRVIRRGNSSSLKSLGKLKKLPFDRYRRLLCCFSYRSLGCHLCYFRRPSLFITSRTYRPIRQRSDWWSGFISCRELATVWQRTIRQ